MEIYCDCCGVEDVANKGDKCMLCVGYGCPDNWEDGPCEYTLQAL